MIHKVTATIENTREIFDNHIDRESYILEKCLLFKSHVVLQYISIFK